MKEHKKELTKLLGIDTTASWSEIYAEIGRLKEGVEIGRLKEEVGRPQIIKEYYPNNPNLHYHGAIPCYDSPCFRI